MLRKIIGPATALALLAALSACGGGGGSTNSNTVTPQSGSVQMLVSDASSADWATIGVKIASVDFVPANGGSNVNVYMAPLPVPTTNLVQLDNLSDVIGQPTIAAGMYTGAIVTLQANPGDVELIAAAEPEAGFPLAGGTVVPGSAIQIQGATGASGSQTVKVRVNFDAAVTVAAGGTTPIDLEFDLSHPAFIVGHTPPTAAGATLWAVDFNGPVRHHPISSLASLVLRHTYGTVTAVQAANPNASLTITKEMPVHPVTTPESATPSGASLTILADATNGTYFYDLDAGTATVVKDFTAEAGTIVGRYVRIAARYQANGTLVATRIWASNTFHKVWLSPEGHVYHVNTTNDTLVISDENGKPVTLTVGPNTNFYFRTPADALKDATPIGTGPSFLPNLVRGFKVHASVMNPTAVDPASATWTADSIDIETAGYGGRISNANQTTFQYTENFLTAGDDYMKVLPYLAPTSANGIDANNNPIVGYKYWDFAYPTLVTSGANNLAVGDFVTTVGSAVNFGGSIGPIGVYGVTYARWNSDNTAGTLGWEAPWTVLLPTPLPLGAVTTAYSAGTNQFAMTLPNATNAATIDVSTTAGSATLAYQVDRTNGVVTVSSIDLTTASGQSAIAAALVANTPVRVYGVPQQDGTIRAYVLTWYTGTLPTL